jgi:hypothetical protein
MRAIETRLRERIKVLETQKAEVEADREVLRNHFAKRFRWWIKLLGEGKAPSLSWLIEDDAKAIKDFQWWHWG